MKGPYSWRLAGLSSFHFFVSRRLLALRFLPFAILLWTLPMHAGGLVTNCTEADLRSALAGGGTVTFECDGTITLTSEMVITNNTVINATGHTISLSGNNSVRIFAVTNGATLSLANLTLRDGRAQYGGAINNVNGRVELLNCTLDGNVAVAGTNDIARGGAIWNSGSLTSRLIVANSVFSRNQVEGGISRGGAAISCGLYVPLGGGGYRYDYGDSTVVNSTFVGNDVSGSNSAAGAAVEMIAGVLTATNCTFSDNRGPSTVYSQGAGLGSYRSCIFARTIGGANIVGPFGDSGFNISDDSPWINGLGSQYNPNLKLGGLADNGGPTKTVALLEGSPAIDAGADSGCPPTDQRGFPRPLGAHCDIGAYEGSLPVPDFGQSFSPAGIVEGEVARLEFTLQNTSSVSYASVSFTNALPPQVRIAAVPAISNACGNGTIIAPSGGGTIFFHGGTLGGNQSCNIGVSVVSSVHGVWTNPPVALWSDKTGQGRSNTAAALSVTGGPVVTTSQVSNFSSNSASLRATIDPAGLATSVFFQYGNTASFGSATTPVSVGGGYAEALALTELGGLISDTTYYCQAVASNAVAVAYGSILSFTTFGAPLTSSWFDQAALLAVLSTTNVVMFSRDGTITMTNTMTIDRDTTLDGTGHNVVLSGGNAVRVFQVNPGVRLTLINLTIANGRHVGTNGATPESAFGGAIYSKDGTVDLLGCVLSNNSALGGAGGMGSGQRGGAASGGAVFNDGGSLNVTNSTFLQNWVTGGRGSGANLVNSGAAGGALGGAIFNRDGVVKLADSVFSSNSATGGIPGVDFYPGPGYSMPGSGYGGGLHSAGGEVFVTNSAFFFNRVVGGSSPSSPVFNGIGGMGNGGAFSLSNGVMVCRRTTFANNQAEGGSGTRYGSGGDGQGGGVFSQGSAVLRDCIFSNNVSRGGGGQLLSGNGYGGAIHSAGTLQVSASTLAGNAAVGAFAAGTVHGGGSGSGYGGGLFNAGMLTVTNSTLFSNQAEGGSGFGVNFVGPGAGSGGGLFNATGAVQLVNSTLSANNAYNGGATPGSLLPGRGGGIFSTNGSVTLWNSIVANSGSVSNCFGTLIDGGHNLSSDGSCNFTASGSLNNTDPLLGLLGDNGGPTPTVPLLIGSPALNAADSDHCPATDQRGVARPFGAACDSGAFESQSVVVAACAESDLSNALAGGGSVTFACDGTIALTNTLSIDRDTTLDGTGHNIVLSGGNAVRVFQVNPGVRLTLINLTIANGRHAGTNGVSLGEAGEAAYGGGIWNQGGVVALLSCVVSNNSILGGAGVENAGVGAGRGGNARGGAIWNDAGTLIVSNTLFLASTSTGGDGGYSCCFGEGGSGGDALGGAICNQDGIVRLVNSLFSTNKVIAGSGAPESPPSPTPRFGPEGGSYGGALHSSGGSVTISDCAFEYNAAFRAIRGFRGGSTFGGAISVSNTPLVCTASRFLTNSSLAGSGGAIHADSSVDLRNCTMMGNTVKGASGEIVGADGAGGAIYSRNLLEMTSCTLAGNMAVGGTGGRPQLLGTGGNALGGGIWNSGNVRITNSTLSSNSVRGGTGIGGTFLILTDPGHGLGGGFYNSTGASHFVHTTISGNLANEGPRQGAGGVTNYAAGQGGGIFATNGPVTLWNSIVANSGSGSNCFGTLIDGGHNLSSDGSCHFTAPGSLNNTDPLLGPLGDYGGPTPTLSLLAGSPALDAADAAYCPPTDQRGVVRPYGPACDIGAFEWWPVFSIRGTIAGWGAGGVRVTAGMASTFANAAGEYLLNGLLAGPYTVRPSAEGRVLMPSTQSVTLGPDAINVNFLSYRSNAFAIEKMNNAVSRFVFAGAPQQSYQLLATSNCVGWNPMGSIPTDANGLFQFYVTNGVSGGTRFFETVKP
jgi:hypothetical protein